MRTTIILFLGFFTLNAFAGAAPAGNALPDLVEKVAPGVVNISSSRFVKQYALRGMPEFFGMFGIPQVENQKQSSLGTGFILDSEGYVLTNNHVIENGSEIIVIFNDKQRIPAKIVGRDRLMDLALLRLKTVPASLKPLQLGDSDKVRIGESAFAIGNPFGLQHTVTSGIISAKNRTIGIGPYDDFLQTDCSINFGNSGGPLFNLSGEVIGINTAINAQGQGLGFSIPINEAKEHLNELKTVGYIPRAWLGVLGENISPALAYHYQLPQDHGVVITRLAERGPAELSGLKSGDILLKINDTEIKERADVQRALKKAKSGEAVKVQYDRQGEVTLKTVKVTNAPDTRRLPDGVI